MKKRLEAELISVAHRVLKLKNKSELRVLHNEAKIVYEKLSVLLFLEEHLPNLNHTEKKLTQSGKPEQKTTMEKTMRQKARLRREYPRSIIQLAGITIRAGAVLSYRFIRIISFPPQQTGAGHVV